jgi:hypothetical protein
MPGTPTATEWVGKSFDTRRSWKSNFLFDKLVVKEMLEKKGGGNGRPISKMVDSW